MAFPFAAPGAHVLYEAQGGSVQPGRDQIPGSASDWQTVQNFVAIRNNDGQIIWGSNEVPLVQLGDINLGKWQPVAHIERPHIFSWVMNNYWFTNFRASQEGDFRFSYYLTSTTDSTNTSATRFGHGARVALVARVLPPGKPTAAEPSRSVLAAKDATSLVLLSARPASDLDGVVLHLREVDGRSVPLLLDPSSAATVQSAEAVNVLEQPMAASTAGLVIGPYETKFVKLRSD
ncbi:MAG: hypothetical protein A2W31_17815 [Planctomycetes bacterium RBG_16_64_10]|nr:MAG: hypothetical protein A2W31_17815 [Planctomycetes bacterium RBG_16_64_10]